MGKYALNNLFLHGQSQFGIDSPPLPTPFLRGSDGPNACTVAPTHRRGW